MEIQVKADVDGHQGSGADPRMYLDPNKIYTVTAIEVHSWSSLVEVAEVEGVRFNSVIFSGVDGKYEIAFEGACLGWRAYN